MSNKNIRLFILHLAMIFWHWAKRIPHLIYGLLVTRIQMKLIQKVLNPLVLFSHVLETSFVSKHFLEILSLFLLVPMLPENIWARLALLSFPLKNSEELIYFSFVWCNIRSVTLSMYWLIFFMSDFHVLIFSYEKNVGIALKVFVFSTWNILEM